MRLVRTFLSFAMLAACSHAHVQTIETYLGPPVPRPDHVLVSYFSIAPGQVRLDQGVGARVGRAVDGQPLNSLQLHAAQDAQVALAERLVERLRQYGLPAEFGDTAGSGNNILVQGQFVGINQGNRTRRMLIGLGAGESSISADVRIYHAAATAPPRFVTAFTGEADSGRTPGAAETLGAGAAAQRICTSAALTGATHAGAETRHMSDTAEASELADAIALRIGRFAVAQGWIPQAALQWD